MVDSDAWAPASCSRELGLDLCAVRGSQSVGIDLGSEGLKTSLLCTGGVQQGGELSVVKVQWVSCRVWKQLKSLFFVFLLEAVGPWSEDTSIRSL